jgi:methanogenic corrinoid protein MtbC1
MSEMTAALAERYLAAQLAGDRQGALRVIVDDGVLRGVPVRELQRGVIQRAQHEIGRLWQENEISVAQEHLATAISQLALAQLYRHLPRAESNGRLVLVACVEGEQHEMGARVVADWLEMAGFAVRYLGANVPSGTLAPMLRATGADMLALSASLSAHLAALRGAVAAVREAMGPEFPIAVGGSAITCPADVELAPGVVVACDGPEALVEQARELLCA